MKILMIIESILLCFCHTFGDNAATYEARKLTPSAERKKDEIQRNDSIKKECYKKYGQTITNNTMNIKNQLQQYFFQEREMLKQKCANDSGLIKVQLEIQRIIKDTIQYTTSEKSARLLLLKKKRLSEENRIHNEPDFLQVHDNFIRTRERLNQIIRDIIKSDSACIPCMSIGTEP